MNKNIESFSSLEELADALGITKEEYAIIREKKRVVALLKQARKSKKMTQTELAGMIGTKQPAIAKMEAGDVADISFDFLIKVSMALGADIKIHTPTAA